MISHKDSGVSLEKIETRFPLFYDGKVFQVMKLQQIPGHIIQVEEDSKEKAIPKWIIFDKKNFTILKKMEIK